MFHHKTCLDLGYNAEFGRYSSNDVDVGIGYTNNLRRYRVIWVGERGWFVRLSHVGAVVGSDVVRLRPSVLGQDRSSPKTGLVLVLVANCGLGLGLAHCGLGLAVLVLFCETRSCNARHYNDLEDLEGHSNLLSSIYSLSVLCLEHHYYGDQRWR